MFLRIWLLVRVFLKLPALALCRRICKRKPRFLLPQTIQYYKGIISTNKTQRQKVAVLVKKEASKVRAEAYRMLINVMSIFSGTDAEREYRRRIEKAAAEELRAACSLEELAYRLQFDAREISAIPEEEVPRNLKWYLRQEKISDWAEREARADECKTIMHEGKILRSVFVPGPGSETSLRWERRLVRFQARFFAMMVRYDHNSISATWTSDSPSQMSNEELDIVVNYKVG